MRNSRDTLRRIRDWNRETLLQYEHLRAAADYVVAALATFPAVSRIALFGSVAVAPTIENSRRLHRPKDVDLAVWLKDFANLAALRRLCGQSLNRLWDERQIGVAHHQVDVFLLNMNDQYLGRLCKFNQCPKQKLQCLARDCGKLPFLQQHDDFVFNSAESLNPRQIRVLYERR